MIQLKSDCLIFKTSLGEQIPCSAELATQELMGGMGIAIEADIVQNASAAVLHYFKHELNQNYVSVDEFADALQKVFQNLSIGLAKQSPDSVRVQECDLAELAHRAGEGWELFFFRELRSVMRHKLQETPQVLRFHGLRPCAKQLARSTRWNRRCQTINDQIVDYLRTCWSAEPRSQSSALIIL